jgi:hypothetical protein
MGIAYYFLQPLSLEEVLGISTVCRGYSVDDRLGLAGGS